MSMVSLRKRTPTNRKVFVACAVPGFATMAYGVYGLFRTSGQTQPGQWIRWVIGGLVLHDFVLAPVVFLVAVVLIRPVPSQWKASLQGALIASSILTLAAWPYVAGYGQRPDNQTLLPNDYGLGLVAVLALVWAVAVATALWKLKARRG